MREIVDRIAKQLNPQAEVCDYYSRTIRDRIMSQCYKKVELVIMAKGRKACKILIIELQITGE